MSKTFNWYEYLVVSITSILIVLLGSLYVPQTTTLLVFVLMVCAIVYLWRKEMERGTEIISVFIVCLVGVLLMASILGIAHFQDELFLSE